LEEIIEKQKKSFAISLFILSFSVTLALPLYIALFKGCIPLDLFGLFLVLIILVIFVLSFIFGIVTKFRFKKETCDISKKKLRKFNSTMDSIFFIFIVLYFIGFSINIFLFLLMAFIFFILGIYLVKKNNFNVAIRGLSRINIRISLLFGISFVFLFFSIPNSVWVQNNIKRKQYIGHITTIAMRVEEYVKKEHEYPKNLKMLEEKGYIEDSPELDEEYIYKIETNKGKKYFTIECPKPELFLIKKVRLSCPVECSQIRYVENKGIIIR